MHNDHQASPAYARPILGTRLALAWAAIVCSTAVIGSSLGLFEMQSRAGAVAQAQLAAGAASGVVAVHAVRAGKRS
jgi:hypothetical protein